MTFKDKDTDPESIFSQIDENRRRRNLQSMATRQHYGAELRKKAFLEHLHDGMSIYRALEQHDVGVKYATFRSWFHRDTKFRAAIEDYRNLTEGFSQPTEFDGGFVSFRWIYFGMKTFPHHQQMIDMFEASSNMDVCLTLCPPEHGKTSLLEDWICFKLATNANLRFMILSKSMGHGRKMIAKIKGRMTNPDQCISPDGKRGRFIRDFGPFYQQGQEATRPWAADYFSVFKKDSDERDYSVEARGWSAAFQGSRADYLLVDDVQDLNSLNDTLKILAKIRQEALTRVHKDGATFIVATRVGDGDLYDTMYELVDEEQLLDRVLEMPALNANGEALCPEMWNVDQLTKRRRQVGDATWWRCYMQAPRGAGKYTFPTDHIEAAKNHHLDCGDYFPGQPIVLALDPALGGVCAGMVASVSMDMLRPLDYFEEKDYQRFDQVAELVETVAIQYPVNYLLIEINASQKGYATMDSMLEVCARHGIEIVTVRTDGINKVDRKLGIIAMPKAFWQGRIEIPWSDKEAGRARTTFNKLVVQLGNWKPGIPDRVLKQDSVVTLWQCWRWAEQWRKELADRERANKQNWTMGHHVVGRPRQQGSSVMAGAFEDIVAEVFYRMQRDGAIIRRAIQVRNYAENRVVVPLTGVAGEPDLQAPMGSMVADAIEHNAMRANSVEPVRHAPMRKQGDEKAKDRARTRVRAMEATAYHSSWATARGRSYRHYFGYGTPAAVCVPDLVHQRARWELRDPLRTYPEHRVGEDVREVLNCAFVFSRSGAWIKNQWGHIEGITDMVTTHAQSASDLWDIVEWVDGHDTVLGICGLRNEHELTSRLEAVPGTYYEIRRDPTMCGGMVPVAAPRRVTLDSIGGIVGHLIGNIDWIQQLTALEVLAARGQVMPSVVILSSDTGEPMMVDGQWNPGSSGKPNILKNVRDVKVLNQNPTPQTAQLIGRMEERTQQSMGLLPQFYGQGLGLGRTGQAVNSLIEAAADPRIREAHTTMGQAESVLQTSGLEMEKAIWPRQKFIVFSGKLTDDTVVEYTPEDDFDITVSACGYRFAGLDITQISQLIPIRKQAGLMSTETAMEVDPMIEDAQAELARLRKEQATGAAWAAFQQQSVAGSVPLPDVLRVATLVGQGMNEIEAMLQAQAEAQVRQAAEAPPDAPEAQPGLAAPGMGVEARPQAPPMGPAPAPSPQERMAQMQQLMGGLRQAPPGAALAGPPRGQTPGAPGALPPLPPGPGGGAGGPGPAPRGVPVAPPQPAPVPLRR